MSTIPPALWRILDAAERRYAAAQLAVDKASDIQLGEALTERLIARQELERLIFDAARPLINAARPKCTNCNGRGWNQSIVLSKMHLVCLVCDGTGFHPESDQPDA